MTKLEELLGLTITLMGYATHDEGCPEEVRRYACNCDLRRLLANINDFEKEFRRKEDRAFPPGLLVKHREILTPW